MTRPPPYDEDTNGNGQGHAHEGEPSEEQKRRSFPSLDPEALEVLVQQIHSRTEEYDGRIEAHHETLRSMAKDLKELASHTETIGKDQRRVKKELVTIRGGVSKLESTYEGVRTELGAIKGLLADILAKLPDSAHPVTSSHPAPIPASTEPA